MASNATRKSKRRVKPAQTLREQNASLAHQSSKPWRSRKAVGGVASLLLSIWSFITKALSPLSILLWPFKSKPGKIVLRILSVVLLFNFFRGAFSELRGVKWPDRKQTTQLTFAVFIFAIIFGLIIGVADYGLDKVFKWILLK